jgi:hypothetical protein
VDARLPNPTIITCNERLPLRILVEKLSESTETVFLSMLQIELIGYTHVRAHDLNRSESSCWVIMSQSNMNIPLGEPSDPVGKEWKVPSRYWENLLLPNTVAPSFDTCNISRTYELEIRVGLSHGVGIESIKPELIVLPLRLPVKVYSGIAPPAALLQRIATGQHKHPGTQFAASAAGGTVPLSPASFYPSTPMTPSYAQPHSLAPAGTTSTYFQPPQASQIPSGADDDEAPPSYEDAMADEIAPVDGPRRDYSVPTPPDRRDSRFGVDSKGGRDGSHSGSSVSGLGRRVSERLFPQNRPGAGMSVGYHSRQSSSDDDFTVGADPVAAGENPVVQATQSHQRVSKRPTLPPSFEESSSNEQRGQ